MIAADRIAGILLLIFGIFVSIQARALPYWMANAPGPGFLPFWLGVLLACAAVAMLARSYAGAGTAGETALPDAAAARRIAVVVALTAGAAALSLVVGLVLASGAFMAATLAYLRPDRARANWTAALIVPAIVWLLFVRWLAVPLPAGPFGF